MPYDKQKQPCLKPMLPVWIEYDVNIEAG